MATYQFTAYTEVSLLEGTGDTNIGQGDTFTIPQSATAQFTVTDDDAYLSGDSWNNENANDQTGQTADIEGVNGEELGNGGQIYAESYWWVYDQNGNWYVMVEIEQEGGSGDYFAFYNSSGYCTPEEGATLTVHSACNVTSDWIQYCTLDGGEMPADLGSLSGRAYIDADGDNTELNADTGEAEAGEAGLTVTLYKWTGTTTEVAATTTTDADGNYSFGDLDGGWYYVKFTKPDGSEFVQKDVGSDATDSDVNSGGYTDWIWLSAGEDKTDVDAGLEEQPGWISGRYTVDADANDNEFNEQTGTWDEGIEGATIELLDLNGNVVATTTTDSDGGYSFDVAPGQYQVRFPGQEGFEFSAQNSGVDEHFDSDADANGVTEVITVGAGQTVANVDAGIKEIPAVLDAVDDFYTVNENEAAGDSEGNVLDNDVNEFDATTTVLKVNGETAGVGEWIDLADGGRVRLDANGELDFDADGDFDALNDGESALVDLTYTIAEVEPGADEYQCLFFNEFAAGTVMGDQLAYAGVTISSASASNPVMIFDTANPTGGDSDLATSNLGKVLIISEDGDSSDPDDNAGGGTFIFDFERDATVEGLSFLDTEEPGAQIRLYDAAGDLIETIQGPVTADGGQASLTFNVEGVARMEVELQGSGAIDNLIYTISGEDVVVAEDTATVTIEVQGVDDPIVNNAADAIDDFLSVLSTETADATPDGNVLDNDIDVDGDALTVVAVNGAEGDVGMSVDGSNGGVVTINADGTYEFDAAGDFDFLARGETAQTTFEYSITDGFASTSDTKQNIVFVIDVSGSTSPAQFEGAPVGDQNGDGIENSVLDAEIAAYKALSAEIASKGFAPGLVDIGLVIFSGGSGADQSGASQIVGTFEAGSSALDDALNGLTDSGFTNFEAPLQQTADWFASVNADATDNNVVYFLSDGMQNRGGEWADEVAALEANYDASIVAVGVGENAVLDQLNTIDNTGGAEIVTSTDALTAALIEADVLDDSADDSATLTVTVTGVNRGPEALDDAIAINEDESISPTGAQSLNILENDTDADNDALSVTSIVGGFVGVAFMVTTANGVETMVTIGENGDVTFDTAGLFDDLNPADSDSFQITYTVSDGDPSDPDTLSDTAVATITINGLNEAPTAVNDFVEVDEDGGVGGDGGSADLNILANDSDPDGDTLEITSVGGVAPGDTFQVTTAGNVVVDVIVQANGDVIFDTAGAFDGLGADDTDEFTFTYTISDGVNPDEQASVTIQINGLNEPPVAVNDSVDLLEGEAIVSLNVLDNDSDPNGDALTVTSAGGEPAGTVLTVTTALNNTVEVTIDANGEVTFDSASLVDVLNDGDVDSFTIPYTIDDGNMGTDTADLTVTITGEGGQTADPSYNIVFLVDTSGSVVGSSGAGEGIIGDLTNAADIFDVVDPNVVQDADGDGDLDLDLSRDGVFDSELDAELLIVQQINNKLGDLGLGGDVEVGVYTYDTELVFGEPANPSIRVATDAGVDTFGAGDDLSAALANADGGSGGVAAYNVGLGGAVDFFTSATANDGATSVNQVFMLTDGDSFDWTVGGDPASPAVVADLQNNFNASLDVIGILDSAADNPTLQIIDDGGQAGIDIVDGSAGSTIDDLLGGVTIEVDLNIELNLGLLS